MNMVRLAERRLFVDNWVVDAKAWEELLTMVARIQDVIDNSIAAEVGLEPGDKLLTINGQEIIDILDYQFYSQDEELILEVDKGNGEYWSIDIEKNYDEDLGLLFEGVVFDKIKVCRNRCLFCFVDQLPTAMRPTLYVKDDDYRYSFLFGNFVTLTNLKESDWNKIESMRLSPLYVSVHTTSGQLRQQMMNNRQAAHIKDDLARLKKAGIQVHTQIVLCPGFNDGDELLKTINDLAGYYPSVQSVGIVPVGLTGHRDDLPSLRSLSPDEADWLIEQAKEWQQKYRARWGTGFVYLADEFYIKANQPVPSSDYYDDYCQIENGIGLIRIFLDEFAELRNDLPQQVKPTEAFLLTGESAASLMEYVANTLNSIEGLTVKVIPVANHFFGGGVTVTGLLTGSDIINQLQQDYVGKKVIIPEVLLLEGSNTLLDDITLDEIEARSGADVYTTDGSARSLLEAILI